MTHFVVYVELEPAAHGKSFGEIEQRISEALARYDENKEVERYREELEPGDIERALEWAAGEARDGTEKRYKFDPAFLEKWPDHEPTNDRYVKAVYELYSGGEVEKDENGNWFRWSQYNPDSKWDWWQIGGRWAGEFQVRKDLRGQREMVATPHGSITKSFHAAGDPIPVPAQVLRGETNAGEPVWALRGDTGLMGSSTSDSGFDVVRKGDVDIEGMRQHDAKKAGEAWDGWHAKAKEIVGADWLEPRYIEAQNEPERREKMLEAGVSDLATYALWTEGWLYGMSGYSVHATREEVQQKAYERFPILPTAYVTVDGEWVARGRVGWFGSISGEIDDWEPQVQTWWNGLPDDAVIAAVDCHI